jgi:sec-independent protein translocase protein TatC
VTLVPDDELHDAGRMTLMEHLAELRRRIVIAIVAVIVGGAVAWAFYEPIFDLLIDPYCDAVVEHGTTVVTSNTVEGDCDALILATDPLEGFATRLKVAGYGGVFLAMPIILWQLWKFVSPGLYTNERRYAAPFVLSAMVLFALGAGLAYWTLPRALGFLLEIGGDEIVSAYSPAKYLGLVVYMMLAFGVGFEFPILLVFLQLAGIIEPATLRRTRRYAVVIIFVLVAVITPSGDPFSLFALAVPMVVFYELSILIGVLFERRRRKSQAIAPA